MPDTVNPGDIVETAKIGEAIFENDILPRIPHVDNEMTVVIDVVSGDYEIDSGYLPAERRLKQRRPDAVVYITPVGPPTEVRAVSLRNADD